MRTRLSLLLAFVLAASSASAQSYTISPPPFLTTFDNSGRIVNNGCIWTYTAGTSTPATTYSDNLGTPNANPIRSDSAGRFTAFLSPGSSYKFVYEAPCTPPAHGTVYRTADNISAMPTSAATIDETGTAGESLTAGQAVYRSDGSGAKVAGLWYKADSANAYSATALAVGIAMANIGTATSGTIRVAGLATGLSGLTTGAIYYVGTAGAMTTTAPTNARIVGQANTTTVLDVTASAMGAVCQVARGCTGLASGTSGGILGYTATGTLASSALLTTNGVLIGGGAGATPTATAVGTTGQIFAGTTSAAPSFQTPSAVGASWVLLKANSGTTTSAAASNVDTIAITGLTASDQIVVRLTAISVTQATASLILQNSTDGVTLVTPVAGASTIAAGETVAFDPVTLQQSQASTTSIVGWANGRGTTIGGEQNITVAAVTQAWTGSWTLALRQGGVTAGGTLQWRWAVYKVLGQ